MVSYETLLNYPDCKILFILHTDTSEKYLGADVSKKRNDILIIITKWGTQ